MDHLNEAKKFARSADGVDITVEWAQVTAILAVAHGIIAWVERMDKKAADADDAAYRAELLQEREARRAMGIMP